MGDCYSVTVRVRTDDGSAAANAMLNYIVRTKDRVSWNIEKWFDEGNELKSLDDCIRFLLAGWKSQPVTQKSSVKWRYFSNDFCASYGWYSVMKDAFIAMCTCDSVAEGSHIDISSNDAGRIRVRKQCGGNYRFISF